MRLGKRLATSHSLLLLLALSALGCSPPPLKGKGGACHSLSDCKPGLACVEERCTDNLEDIAGSVPRYPAPDAGAAAEAGAAEAGMNGMDGMDVGDGAAGTDTAASDGGA